MHDLQGRHCSGYDKPTRMTIPRRPRAMMKDVAGYLRSAKLIRRSPAKGGIENTYMAMMLEPTLLPNVR